MAENYWLPGSGNGNPYLDQTSAATRARRNYYSSNPTRFGGIPAVYDAALRQYVDARTGNAYTGPVGAGYSTAGVFSTTNPNPEAPKPDFQRNVLYPEIATPATALAKTISAGSALTPNFNTLATDYKSASDSAIKSYDTAPLESEVRGLQRSYETGQGDVLTKFGESNARYAQETKDSIARLTAQLDQTEANIRTQAGAASSLAGSVARFPGVGGGDTITANNAGLAPRIARATYLPQLAAEERIGNLRYGQIANIEMPVGRELYGNDQGLLSFTAALNDKFRGDRFQIASFLNDVKTRMAAMPLQLQENYANYVLRLIGGEQAIAAGQLSNLSAAQRLIAASEFLERNIPEPATAAMQSYPVSTPNMGGPARQAPNVSVDDLMRVLQPAAPGGYRPAGSPGGFQPMNWDERMKVLIDPAAYAGPPRYPSGNGAAVPGTGWGRVNGDYIGAGADFWNDAMYGQVVNP